MTGTRFGSISLKNSLSIREKSEKLTTYGIRLSLNRSCNSSIIRSGISSLCLMRMSKSEAFVKSPFTIFYSGIFFGRIVLITLF